MNEPILYTHPEQVPVTEWYVKVHDDFMSGWGGQAPEHAWTLFACNSRADADVVFFNCQHCRPEFSVVQMFRRGEPKYKLPRDEKALAAKLDSYRGSIVGAFMADTLLSGSGMWEWMRWGKKSVSVIIPNKRWLTPGMDYVWTDEKGIEFKFLTHNHAGWVNPGEYYLDMPRVIDREGPKFRNEFARKTIWVVKKKKKEKWGTERAKVEIVS